MPARGTQAPAELLLPLSYALSRPIVVASRPSVLPIAIAVAVVVRHVDRILCGLLVPARADVRPDALFVGASLFLQLISSTSWWTAAEFIAILSGAQFPRVVTAVTHETIFGVLGAIATALAFLLPRAVRAWQAIQAAEGDARREEVSDIVRLASFFSCFTSPLRWMQGQAQGDEISAAAATGTGAGTGTGTAGWDWLSATSAASSSPRSHLNDAAGGSGGSSTAGGGTLGTPPAPLNRSGALAANPTSGGSSGGEGRRELFGFRRRMRSIAMRATGSVEEDDGGDLSGSERRRRRDGYHRGESIMANTEVMTQMALAAKNDELERLSVTKTELVAGIAEVLLLLSRATEQNNAAVVASDSQLTNSSGHRTLLSACLQAQALLQSLLQEHDDGTHAHKGRSSAVTAAAGSAVAAQHLAPSRPSEGAASLSSGTGGAESGLTWTGALGATDVSARLYQDAD